MMRKTSPRYSYAFTVRLAAENEIGTAFTGFCGLPGSIAGPFVLIDEAAILRGDNDQGHVDIIIGLSVPIGNLSA